MPWTRSRTVRWIAIFAVLQFALLVGCLVLEVKSTGGDEATVSHVMRRFWATSDGPWIVLVVSHMVGGPIYFLVGHWFAAGKKTYQAIRDEQQWPADVQPLPPVTPDETRKEAAAIRAVHEANE